MTDKAPEQVVEELQERLGVKSYNDAFAKAFTDRIQELEAERDALRDAVWQALDDMGPTGQCVCLAAKQQLIDAYIPDADPDEWPAALQEKKR